VLDELIRNIGEAKPEKIEVPGEELSHYHFVYHDSPHRLAWDLSRTFAMKTAEG